MTSRRTRWLSALGGILFIGGGLLANYGTSVTPASAAPPASNPGNPFQAILDKLDQVLTAIQGIGGGGGQEGNHTLRWDQNLPAAQRFVVLASFANEAVLDKETGLVWEQSPATTTHEWSNARFQCTSRTTGGRRGWRLPSVHELASLIDPSVASPGPTLPSGHPFLNVQSTTYWSVTSVGEAPLFAWYVFFGNGSVSSQVKTNTFQVWCVRGGMNADQY